jgi:CysZ protein
MSATLTSLLLGARQLFDPAVLRILIKSIAVTLVLVAALAAAGWFALDWALARAGMADSAFAGADTLRSVASALLAIIALWLLWRIVAMAVIQFFADEVVQAVERKHYPAAASMARDLTVGEEVRQALGAAGRALLANVIALPFAVVLLFTGIGPALLFLAVNAVLLGRELQDMVWLRHRADRTTPAPLRRGERAALGGVVAGLMMVPLVQFVAPLLGAASAVHLVHRKRG